MERQVGVFLADQSVDPPGPHAACPILKEGKDRASDRTVVAVRHCDWRVSAGPAQYPCGKSGSAQRVPADWIFLCTHAGGLGVVVASRARADGVACHSHGDQQLFFASRPDMDSIRCLGAIRTQALASNNYFLDSGTDRQIAGCCSGRPFAGGVALRSFLVCIVAVLSFIEFLSSLCPT